jgi:hypothetical protein
MMKHVIMIAALAACGASQKEVAMQGSDLDLARVAGDWQGEYKGAESGRSGPVNFSLSMGSHTAEGQVMLGGATPLKIEFVKVKQNDIKGTIAPYTDPTCSCEVETTFFGTLDTDAINGTFETKVSKTGQTQSGTWTVTRKRG